MSEMDNLNAMLDGPEPEPRPRLISLSEILSDEEAELLRKEPRECCGLPEGGPNGDYGDLVQTVCPAGNCVVLNCPCGASDVSFGPLDCPCQSEE